MPFQCGTEQIPLGTFLICVHCPANSYVIEMHNYIDRTIVILVDVITAKVTFNLGCG